MKDNNPFQPALSQPVDDSILATDQNADSFADNILDSSKKAPRTSVMLDGISPNFDEPTTDKTSPSPVNPNAFDMNLSKNETLHDDSTSISVNVADSSATNASPEIETLPQTPVPELQANDFLDSVSPSDDKTADPTADAIAALADQTDNKKIASKDKKKAAKKIANSPNQPSGEKPPKQFTISILTIILFVLTVAGISCAIYFYIQNNKNSNALADAEAKIEQLTYQSDQTNNSDNKTSGQFDALQDKIAKQTKDIEEKDKTIGEQKTQIEQLNKDKADLTAKTEGITSLTNQVSNLLNSTCMIGNDTPCTATITPAQGNNSAKLNIKPKTSDQ